LRDPAERALEDHELLRQFQDGDQGAFDDLVRRHAPFVLRQARRILGEDPSADDVAQEVFIRVYRSSELFREPRNFRGWLATIASRLALNELRTRRRKRWIARSTLESDPVGAEWRPGDPGAGLPAEDDALRKERIHAVREAVLRLPARQREAIWLQRFEGWNLTEVGDALDLSVPAVKSLLHRARAALATDLAGYWRDGTLAEANLPAAPGWEGKEQRP
jgi:RNA polymerase sigma-70 factor (ECF subfamily)